VTRRAAGLTAGLAAASAAGAVAAVSLTGAQAAPSAPAVPRLTTAQVLRTNLAATVLTEGTLGYLAARPVINLGTGTYTWLPRPGHIIFPGEPLYRVDNLPVILMAGGVPAWRPFQLGMTAGPDVLQLQAGLIARHFADGLFTTATDQYTYATALAVERWQAAHGLVVTGQIPLGQLIFLPGRVRVGGWQVAPGQQATPGQQPYLVTSDRRIVTVPVSPDMPVVRLGQRVSIILPSQASTPGVVTGIGPPQLAPAGSSSQAAPSQLSVTPLRPAATGTGSAVPVQISLAVQVVRGTLAVPVSALLALAGGGYGLEVVLPAGAHRVIGVSVGVFASGEVQVSGAGLVPGMRVVTAQ
jgi:peptidoglycan hydrolase-like protein with peptidoglycan-binding domain